MVIIPFPTSFSNLQRILSSGLDSCCSLQLPPCHPASSACQTGKKQQRASSLQGAVLPKHLLPCVQPSLCVTVAPKWLCKSTMSLLRFLAEHTFLSGLGFGTRGFVNRILTHLHYVVWSPPGVGGTACKGLTWHKQWGEGNFWTPWLMQLLYLVWPIRQAKVVLCLTKES